MVGERRAWETKAWIAYLGIATPLVLAYHFGPKLFNAGPVMNVIGASAVVTILLGTRSHHSRSKLAWRLIAFGQALFLAGDVVAYNYERFFHAELPYPSLADAFYLAVYPLLVAGLLIMVRKRTPGGDRPALLDSFIIAIGLGVLSWKFLISPYATDVTLSILTKLTSMAYPIMDVLVLTVIVRLAVGGGRRGKSFSLLLTSVAALLVTDAVFGYKLLHGGYETGGLLDVGWMVFYVLLGAAALHPSMRTISEPAPEQEMKPGRWKLVLLAVAALAGPATQAGLVVAQKAQDSVAYVGSSMVLFVLVVWRMAGLVRRMEQAAVRERALRESGTNLVTATNREEIYSAALEAARRLSGPSSGVLVASGFDGHSRTSAIVASTGVHEPGNVLALPGWSVDLLARHQSAEIPPKDVPAAFRPGWLFLTPLFTKATTNGLIAVSSPERPTQSVKDGLSSLGSQVALALESAALTENAVRVQSEDRFRSLVQNSSDVVAVIDADTTIRYVSPSVEHVLGYTPNDLENTRLDALLHADDLSAFVALLERTSDPHADAIECRMRRSDGSWGHVETVRTNLLHDPNVGGIVLNTRDVGDRKAFEEQLAQQAFSDEVTGLANRALLRNRIEHALDRQTRTHLPLAILFVDLDDFKTVNDSLGHAAGDQLLQKVGERIGACLRSSDTAARLGGDEFGVLLEDHGGAADVADVAERILGVIRNPFILEGKEVFISASMGVAFGDTVRQRGSGPDELLRNADVAMYTAKHRGKGRYQVFEPAMHRAVMHRLELKADLQRAVENREFELYYQPVVRMDTQRISGVEALIRWRHPIHGMVPPDEFIALAEETGLIVPIGSWVLHEACRQAERLARIAPDGDLLTMSMNVSARQLQRPEIVQEVAAMLQSTGLTPSRLVLEITESVMMQDVNLTVVRLGELKELGVRLAVDDFGTGYSSLNYIRQFPIDILKIDKSFIRGLTDGGEVSALTRTIIDLARALELEPVAEGIEHADQAAALLDLGCVLAQGFYYFRPMPRAEIERMLAEQPVALPVA